MVYAGEVPGQPQMFARVIVAGSEGYWQITVNLQGAGPFLGRPISLSFGQESRTAFADPQGNTLFTPVPLSWIMSSSTPDLHITI
jgi:hypothetical protein